MLGPLQSPVHSPLQNEVWASEALQARVSLPHIPILVTTSTSKIPGNAFSVTDTNPREAEFKVLF